MTSKQIEILINDGYLEKFEDDNFSNPRNTELYFNDFKSRLVYVATENLEQKIKDSICEKINLRLKMSLLFNRFDIEIDNTLKFECISSLDWIPKLRTLHQFKWEKLIQIHNSFEKHLFGNLNQFPFSYFFYFFHQRLEDNLENYFQLKKKDGFFLGDTWIELPQKEDYWFGLLEIQDGIKERIEDIDSIIKLTAELNFIKSKITELENNLGGNKNNQANELIIESESKSENNIDNVGTKSTGNETQKLKWLGTPSQFGFIIQELIGKGYLDRPTSSNQQDAKIYLSIFNINTTEGTLAKELSENTNSITPENAGKLKMTHINKLSNNNQKVTGK